MDLSLDQQSDLINQLDATYRLQTQLQLIKKNILLINQSPNAQIITIGGGNLYELAEKYYGDARLWNLIADANNLTDPQISGITTLLIPQNNTDSSEGILNA